MKKTVLITGGAGYVGKATSFACAQRGYEVLVIDDLLHSQRFEYPWGRLIKGNINDRTLLSSLFSTYSFDSVIHTAGYIQAGGSVHNPSACYDSNIKGLLVLLEVMKEFSVKNILFCSSAAVYGEFDDLLTENNSKEPISPYGRSKLMGEQIIKDYAYAYGFSYIIFRYFNVAGALPEYGLLEEHEPETHVIPLVIRAIRDQKPFTIFGNNYATNDGTTVRDYVHVWDVAQANVKAIEHLQKGNPSDIFNISSDTGYSIKEIITIAQKIAKKTIPIEYAAPRQGDVSFLVGDSSRARDILQWSPDMSKLETIIQSVYAGMFQVRELHSTSNKAFGV